MLPGMGTLAFDAKTIQFLERLYRTADVRRRRRLVMEALAPQPGEDVLDVGCGPGFYVAEIAEVVGPAGSVTGVDQSPSSLAAARERAAAHPNVAFHEGEATALPVGDAAFDAALSVQVYEYVPDTLAGLAEIHRALRPGGRVVLWDVDWSTVSWHTADPERMARVLAAWDEHLTHPALPRTLAATLRRAGFEDVTCTGHTFATTALDPETYGGAISRQIAQFVPGRRGVTASEAAAWAEEQRALDEAGEFFFACVQFCFQGRRPS